MSYRPDKDPRKEIVIEDIKRIKVESGDILTIQVSKHTDPQFIEHLLDQIKPILEEKNVQLMVFSEELKFGRISIAEGKLEVTEEQ
jgi:hypothetical protein